jgi:hypothetical protein
MGLDCLRAKLSALPGRNAPVDELLRNSVVAPLVFHLGGVEGASGARPVRDVHVWFVAYGDYSRWAREAFAADRPPPARRDMEFHFLKPEELAARNLRLTAPPEHHEWYFFASFPLLDRVRLQGTSRAYLTRREDSLVLAITLDPRFHDDPRFANRWRAIIPDSAGKPRLGEPLPYEGAVSYLRVTRLNEPAGAMLWEYHSAFVEPHEWFKGASVLRAKLPVLIQSEVRTLRRQLAQPPETHGGGPSPGA